MLLIVPAVLMVACLVLYPVGYAVWLSFHRKHAYLPVETFIGLTNYKNLFVDPQFWQSFWLGTVYGFSTIGLQIVLGVGAALLLAESFKGRSLVRGIALFPYVVPTIVVVLIWRWILNDSYGLLNHILQSIGIVSAPVTWLGPSMILISLILVSTWTFFPFVLITVLARLQTINPELYDAAAVDGASAWQRFYHVTLPQLRTILFVVILLRFIFMFTKFDIVWLLGGGSGGTGRFIRTLPVYTYIKTFGQLQVGAGAALAVIMVLILVSVAVPYFKYFRPAQDL
tara:strand:+ start:1833 stop:2684 length:852 start_codon:yes stop_codon:yes gene_type:complete